MSETCHPCGVTMSAEDAAAVEAAKISTMQVAAASAITGVTLKHGGPFGACVVRDGIFVSVAHNTVLMDGDPTCHAEMNAIRYACKALDSHDLSECELYTSCEPCPMCWGAIQWCRVRKVYTGVDRHTAAKFGFDDKVFYDEVEAHGDHYKLNLGQCRPNELPTMLDVYTGIESGRMQALLEDTKVNLTFRRRAGSKAIGFRGDGGRFNAAGVLGSPPAKRLRAESQAGVDAAAAVADAADAADSTSPAAGANSAEKEAAAASSASSAAGSVGSAGGAAGDVGSPPSTAPGKPETHAKYFALLEAAMRDGVRLGQNKEREVFASCVVKGDELVSIAVNEVVKSRDATATSEVLAIRRAAAKLKTYNLTGCVLYTTLEPDVMSLGAILWSRIDRLFYALTQRDAAQYGFEEGLLHYRELFSDPDAVQAVLPVETGVGAEDCENVFKKWQVVNAVIY